MDVVRAVAPGDVGFEFNLASRCSGIDRGGAAPGKIIAIASIGLDDALVNYPEMAGNLNHRIGTHLDFQSLVTGEGVVIGIEE